MKRQHPFLDALQQYFEAHPDAREWQGGSYAMVELMNDAGVAKRLYGLPGQLQRWRKQRLCAEVRLFDKSAWVFYRDAVIEYCNSNDSVQ